MPGRLGFALRRTRPRHFLMCPPTYFDVAYAINPWMDPSVPVDRALALAQWTALVEAYRAAGHRVDLLDPVPGLPDMVYAANGAFALDGRVLPARFAYAERAAEATAHAEWHRRHGGGELSDEGDPARAVEALDAGRQERGERLRREAREVVRRPPLHPGRQFLAEQLKKKLRHG